MKRFFVATAAILMLSNCAQPEDYGSAIANSVPASKSIKSQIVRDARDFLSDPYSVRDAEITKVATFASGTQGLCVKANAKNKSGGYTGRQTLAVMIRDGVLIGNIPNHPLCSRPDISWRPFPELEALRSL